MEIKQSGTIPADGGEGGPVSLPLDAALGLWFLLIALAFWAPYLHLPFPPAVLSALYGLFLLGAVAASALRVLRARETMRETVAEKEKTDTARRQPAVERRARRGK